MIILIITLAGIMLAGITLFFIGANEKAGPKRITLSNLHEATAQEVYNQAKKHLLTQRKKSTTGFVCRLHGDNNRMSAIG